MLPELTFGGETVIDLYTPYAATQFFFNFWPVESFGVGETYLQWDPPLFENFCMSQGWSWTLLTAWIDWEFKLWECDAGLFAYILSGDSYECGLENYKFKGHLLDAPNFNDWLGLSFVEKVGEFLPNTCEAKRPNSNVYSGDVVVEEVIVIDPAETTDTTDASDAAALNTVW